MKKMKKIISGGQTGADRAALDAAIERGIPHGGWLPKGRTTEDGPLGQQYRLQELDSYRYRDRTEKNVKASDGTLIVSYGPLTGGSALTQALALRYNRPCLHLNMDYFSQDKAVRTVEQWLEKNAVETLNVAGPRAGSDERIYETVRKLLLAINPGER
jgi:predicted Rossmann-fold nucleotide-binding protein